MASLGVYHRGTATRKPVDFKLFLSNEENKLPALPAATTGLGEQGGSLSDREMWDSCGSGGRQGVSAGHIRWRCEYIKIHRL